MHKRLVFSMASRILFIGVLMMGFPLLWALYDNWQSLEVSAFRGTIILGLIFSLFGILRFPIKKSDYKKLTAKDGLGIVGLSWILLSFFGSLPFYWSQSVPSFMDAIFETVSGFTTTGASVITDIESLPRGILFWRSMTHWIGGMGIIVLFVALLPALGQKASQLFKAEAPGISVEKTEPRIKETAKHLWYVYFALSLSQTLMYMLAGMGFYDALCHTFGTMATGGFSTKNASMAAFDPTIQWITIIFMFLAGVNFIFHYYSFRGKPQTVLKSEEFRVYTSVIVICTVFFALIIWESYFPPIEQALREGAFQVIAIVTTTGYVTADFSLWPPMLKFMLVLLMFMGGCGGSTGGGMKVARVLVTVKAILRSIKQAVLPNAVLPVKIDGKSLNERVIISVLTYFTLYIILFFLGTFFFAITEQCEIVTAFTASVSALSNIGPGLGKVGPMENYAWISPAGKSILCFLMLAGRLELYAVLILLLPASWRK